MKREEDALHKKFAALIRDYESKGKLHCAWWSYDSSGEKRPSKKLPNGKSYSPTGALLKAKGLRPGKSDYEFKVVKNTIAYHVYIEFKTEKGTQGPNQKLFEESCYAVNEFYYIARDVNAGLKILEYHDII